MWDTVLPHASYSKEPIELRILKQELARVKCNCKMCELPLKKQRSGHHDQAIQVEWQVPKNPFYRDIYSIPDKSTADINQPRVMGNSMVDYFHKDMFCPNCYFLWDLLRNFTKTVKDEECETTRTDNLSCDKSTENIIKIVDSTTSVTNKPVLKLPSNLALRDKDNSFVIFDSTKVVSHDSVKFLDDFININDDARIMEINRPFHGNCFCMENYMDSIRPPL